MYKCYKGEDESPFSDGDKRLIWGYEQVFEWKYQDLDNPGWFSFFEKYNLRDRYMALVKEKETLPPKSEIFDLWLVYLFNAKNRDAKKIYENLS